MSQSITEGIISTLVLWSQL